MEFEVVNGKAGVQDTEALRHRAASALERGLSFVEAKGDELAILRTRVMLGAEPIERLLVELERRQRADGSFPALGIVAGGGAGLEGPALRAVPQPVLGTLEALMLLGDLSALHVDAVGHAAAFLDRAQLPDGSWGVDSSAEVNRVTATGLLAGSLARTTVVRPHVLDDAGQFLAHLFSPDLLEGGDWGVIAAFGCFFGSLNHDLSDGVLQWVGRELERGYRTRRFEAVATLRVILHCDAAALPGAALAPLDLLGSLLDEQAKDGGFAALSPGGPAARVAPTVDAMLAIPRLCKLI